MFEPGIKVVETEEIITRRERSELNASNIAILKDLLDIVAEEDVDKVFVSLLSELRDLGYRLQDEPQALLERLKRKSLV